MTTLNNNDFNEISYSLNCSNCKEEIVITREEKVNRRFVCPNCNFTNIITPESSLKEEIQLEPIVENSYNNQKFLSGISGWLLLPAISLFLSILWSLNALIESVNSNYLGYLHPTILSFTVFANAAEILFICFLIYFFFKKMKITILLFKLLLIYRVAVPLIMFSLFLYYYKNIEYSTLLIEISKQLIISSVWFIYFHKSVRVKNTFINV